MSHTSATASTKGSDLQKEVLSFLKVGVEQPRDFKKPNTVTSSKYLLQFVITDYYLLVIRILVAEIKKKNQLFGHKIP